MKMSVLKTFLIFLFWAPFVLTEDETTASSNFMTMEDLLTTIVPIVQPVVERIVDRRDAQLVREIMARVEERTSMLDQIQVRFAVPIEYSQLMYDFFTESAM